MRQPLKRLNEIFEPDDRSRAFARYDAAGCHSKTLEDHYADISAIRVSDEVPKAIRDEFDTIRNLYLYSWYVYDFTVPATLYAYTLVEKAIKEKCRRAAVSLERNPGLSKLLALSIAKGWLTDAAFPFALEWMREEIVPAAGDEELPTRRSIPCFLPTGTDYCERLAISLPKLRNMDAHGEAGLGFPASALSCIEICACIINALFPTLDE